jgi:hypothetical protein
MVETVMVLKGEGMVGTPGIKIKLARRHLIILQVLR